MEIKNLAQPNQGSTGQGEAQALLTSAPILRTFNFGGTIQVKLLEQLDCLLVTEKKQV